MNDIVSKLKIVNMFKGSGYPTPLDKLVDVKNINSYESFLDNEKLSPNLLKFLTVQAPEDREYLFNEFIKHENIYSFTNSTDKLPEIKRSELNWFLLFLDVDNFNTSVITNFIQFLDSVNNFKFINSFEFTKSICNNLKELGATPLKNKFLMLSSIFQNENLNDFSFDDISKIIDNVPDTIDLSGISKEALEIYTDKLSVLLPEATIENLNFCKLINNLCSESFLLDCQYWIDGVFEYSNKILSIINLFEENEKPIYLKNLIESYNLFSNFSYDEYFDSFLDKLHMKISYHARYDSLEAMLNDGLEVIDKHNSIINVFNLAKIKDIGSKGLYRKAIEDKDLCSKVVDYLEKFKMVADIIDLGSLNKTEIYSLIKYFYYDLSRFKFKDLSYKISFKEFQMFIDNKLDINVFEYTSNLKLAERIKAINILVSAQKQSNNIYNISDIINIIEVSDLLKKHNVFGNKDIETYIDWRMLSSKVSFDISSKEELFKVKAYLGLKPGLSLLDASKNSIDEYVLNLDYIKDGFKTLEISEEFILEHKENSIKFILDGGFDIALSYYNNYYVKPLQRKNLGLIVKSILAGKYNELKFNYEDISKEIEFNVNKDSFNNWVKDDEVSNDVFAIKDTGDFNTIMTIGVNPVRSCMNYTGGSYSYCLLSNIDTAKKILTIHKNGVYVGRAILRLTKSSKTGDTSKTLSFIDVETNSEVSSNNDNEQLVLFVEKMYSSLDLNDLVNVYGLMIDFLKQKAASIGAQLMLSYYYDTVATRSNLEVSRKETYLFITASKNGAQYLDSLDGSTTYSCCYKNANVLLY